MNQNKTESYLRCRCGCDCNWLDAYPHEPCWGQVDKQDEDSEGNESHACEGHSETLDWCCNSATAQKYIPEPTVITPAREPEANVEVRHIATPVTLRTRECITHHFACDCREAMMAEYMETQRAVIDWQTQSDEGLRLRCGELTAQEIRTVRAVLAAILPTTT